MDNQWVQSYLDALLSYGLSSEHTKGPLENDDNIDDRKVFTKYYVNQLLQKGEAELNTAWRAARQSARTMEEKDARLEYLSWRVWHMKTRRRAHVVEEEDFTTSVVDDVEETSEDDEILAPEQQHAQRVERNDKFVQAARIGGIRMAKEMRERNEAVEMVVGREVNEATWENREHDLYVVLISAHGLVRGFDMELGKDPDTGGQVKYVVEMAKAMAEHPAVGRVDLVTRLIEDPSVHSSYGVPEERLLNVGESRADLDTEDPEAGAFIVRLPFGNPKQYIRKEELWPHIPELADRTRDHIQRTLERLNRRPNVRPTKLHVVHGHYADASEAAALVSAALGVEMMMTGHSLGRNKLDHLLKTGASRTEVERQYAISRRIEAEERGLDHASIVFTSTEQEIVDQWGLYDGFDVNLEASLRRHRQGGRHMPRMHVIPPGLDFSAMDLSDVTPSQRNSVEEERMSPTSSPGIATSPPAKEHMMGHRRTPEVWNEITKFLRNPHKPVVLAMSRPDAKKNITTLVKAFGEHPLLREVANLVLVMGNRDDIENMATGSQKVIQKVITLIDTYDLYGSVAYPKKHRSTEVTDIYRFAQRTQGVFVNIALQEPFGLTLIEAAAHGVPLVATKHGGPNDIIKTLRSGVLVEPTDSEVVANKIMEILGSPNLWHKYSQSGLRHINFYSWRSHCERYMVSIETRRRIRARPVHKRSLTFGTDSTSTGQGSVQRSIAIRAIEAGSVWDGQFKARSRIHSEANVHDMDAGSFDDSVIGLSSNEPARQRSSHERSSLERPGDHFQAMIVVTMDGPNTFKRIASALKVAIAYRRAGSRKGIRIAIVLAGCGDLESLKEEIANHRVEITSIDFIIANAGAEIWRVTVDPDDADEVVVDSIDEYDEHIFFRWDLATVSRTIERAALLASSATNTPRKSTIHEDIHLVVPVSSTNKHPFHRVYTFADRFDPTLVGRLIKRLRCNGVRAQMVIQSCFDAPNLNLSAAHQENNAVIHVTPIRATRALALRWLANYINVPMRSVALICGAQMARPPTNPSIKMERTMSAAAFVNAGEMLVSGCSDLPSMVSGAQQTLVLVDKCDTNSASIELGRFEWHADQYTGRVSVAEDDAGMRQWMATLALV